MSVALDVDTSILDSMNFGEVWEVLDADRQTALAVRVHNGGFTEIKFQIDRAGLCSYLRNKDQRWPFPKPALVRPGDEITVWWDGTVRP